MCVLYIDAGAVACNMARSVFKDCGHELVCRPTLKEGMARLADGGINCVILSLSLPDSRGMATLGVINKAYPWVPVVVVVPVEDLGLAEKCIKAGAQDVVPQPEMPSRLLWAFHLAMIRHEATKTSRPSSMVDERLNSIRERVSNRPENGRRVGGDGDG